LLFEEPPSSQRYPSYSNVFSSSPLPPFGPPSSDQIGSLLGSTRIWTSNERVEFAGTVMLDGTLTLTAPVAASST
jgi:hypothetical protein